MKRIMYLEHKGSNLSGVGRIGWVDLSKSRRSYHYENETLQKCVGYKYNAFNVETGVRYWISGPRRDGNDHLHGGRVEIDEDARVEYWSSIRKKPELTHLTSFISK